MSQFVAAALLLGLVAAAFATSALWRSSRTLALLLAIGLPLGAAGLYHVKGNPDALNPVNLAAPHSVEDAIAQLRSRLARDPGDVEGQVLLARSYMTTEQYDLARDAYARATALLPDDSDLKVEYAETLMRTDPDHRFPPAAVAMLQAAVASNPENQHALFFLGVHQMQSGDPAAAAATWEKLLPMLPPDTGALIRQQIDGARLAAHLPPLPPMAEAAPASGPTLTISVGVAPDLAKAVQPGDVLFVYARSADAGGAGPPLAVKRIGVEQLPLQLTLSDADSPMPTAKLSSQDSVVIMARLSKSGTVQAGSGDLEADPQTVAVGDGKPLVLTLSREVH